MHWNISAANVLLNLGRSQNSINTADHFEDTSLFFNSGIHYTPYVPNDKVIITNGYSHSAAPAIHNGSSSSNDLNKLDCIMD